MNTLENNNARGPSAWSRALVWLVACIVPGLVAAQSGTARNSQLYDVTVSASSQAAAFEDALRIALQRATGRRNASADPALAALVSEPQKFVAVVRPAGGGGTQVSFDGAALERAVAAAGIGVWRAPRPRTLIVLRSSTIDPAVKQRLDDAASQRGVPIAITTASAIGLPSGEVSRETGLAAARQAGSDALLVGEGSANATLWRWSLHTTDYSAQTAGEVTAGLHDAVDAYVRTAIALQALPESETLVEFTGVDSLRAFATVTDSLTASGGVEQLLLRQVSANAVMFRIVARGGSAALLALVSRDGRFEPVAATSGAALAFRLRL
ncbi:MAG TPA: DUF2066 domain-containing protein [Steroidobacteraceae bacterium]|nr:DUF2066 domain-containing protein [Steroidobacteraceae bacterium]HRX90214.1 DUF2066 domain-containing protein [Steroidobacteraceae bacterium]